MLGYKTAIPECYGGHDVNLRGVLYGIAAVLPAFHRQAEDRPHSGDLRRDQERRPHPAGRTAAGIDRRRAADDGVSPGFVRTELADSIDNPEVREQIRRSRDEFALPPDAVARAIAFAVEQPYDVEIGDITIRPTVQG
jgi:NADP-dependent 3-hydroxy acid dehydrogenase YdfG